MMEINGAGHGGAPGVRQWERKLTALARQIDDPEALGQVLDLVDHLNRQIGTAVRDLYAEGSQAPDRIKQVAAAAAANLQKVLALRS